MNVAVVGGSGFIGRHVVARLTGMGAQVVTLDRREPPRLLDTERFVAADLSSADQAETAARACRAVTEVAWLAAEIRHRTGVDEQSCEDLRVMVEGPLRFLAALPAAPRALVYASSIQVYGHPRYLPVDEDHPTDPITAYGVGKLAAERFLSIACAARGTAMASLRLAFVYGPGQHPENVIPRFISRARNGEPPVVHGDGSEVRDDVYVEDVARAVGLALSLRADGPFNIAGGRPRTLLEVAEAVCALAPGALKPRHVDAPSRWVDRWFTVERARSSLGFTASTALEDGLRAMWLEAGNR